MLYLISQGLKVILAKDDQAKPTYTEATLLTQFIVPMSGALLLVLTFAGVALGFTELIPAICKASEMKKDRTTFIVCLCFASAPLIFSILCSFISKTKMTAYQYTSPEIAFLVASYSIIAGFGFGFASYALCIGNKALIIGKMKQKNFNMQFYISNIFIELISIVAFICYIVPLTALPKVSDITVEKSEGGSKSSTKTPAKTK